MPPTSYRDDFLKNGYALQRECLPAWPLEGYEDILKTAVPGVLWKTDPKGYLKEPALRALASCWEVGSLMMECYGEALAVEQTCCRADVESNDVCMVAPLSAVWAYLAISKSFVRLIDPERKDLLTADGSIDVSKTITIDLKRGDVLVVDQRLHPSGFFELNVDFIWLSASSHNSRPDLPPAILSDYWGWLFPTPAAEFV